MAIFKYTLPSGAAFTVDTPENTTQDQADRIFYEQVAAGALVGYTAGQTLTSTASVITKFELSRLDRGTAGVDNIAILSVIQGLPITTGIPTLVNTPLTNPITQADVILMMGNGLGATGVGPLTDYQVQVLQAQIANLVDQAYNLITKEKGIGQYGFTCYQLEKAGYIKPGTTARFMDIDPDQFVSIMYSPGIWTGLGSISTLDDLLSDPSVQSQIQTILMEQSYDSLVAAGVISGVPTPAISASTGTVFTQTGLQSTSISALLSGTPLTSSDLSTLATGALGVPNLSGLANSITTQVTGQVGALVTNASKFGTAATALWSASSGIGNLSTLASTGISGLTSGLSNGLTGLANGALGNLSGLASGALGNITGLASGALGSLSNISSLTTNLTNLVPGSLSNLSSSLDIFGKASQFSINFANPLGGLTTGLGSLTSGLTSGLSGITGSLTSGLGSLTSGLTSSLSGITGSLTSGIGSLTSGLTGSLSGITGSLGGLTSGLSSSLSGLTSAFGSLGSLMSFASLGGLFGGGGDLVSNTQVAAGFTNTVNRKTVDAAVTRVLGNSKITPPSFEFPSAASLGSALDISQAQNVLAGLKNQASGIVNQTSGLVNQAQNIASQTNRMIG